MTPGALLNFSKLWGVTRRKDSLVKEGLVIEFNDYVNYLLFSL